MFAQDEISIFLPQRYNTQLLKSNTRDEQDMYFAVTATGSLLWNTMLWNSMASVNVKISATLCKSIYVHHVHVSVWRNEQPERPNDYM